jgi:hypothetical protein
MRPWTGIVWTALALLPLPQAAAQPCLPPRAPAPASTYRPPAFLRYYIQSRPFTTARRPERVPPPKPTAGPERLPAPKQVPGSVPVVPPAPPPAPERVPAPRP